MESEQVLHGASATLKNRVLRRTLERLGLEPSPVGARCASSGMDEREDLLAALIVAHCEPNSPARPGEPSSEVKERKALERACVDAVHSGTVAPLAKAAIEAEASDLFWACIRELTECVKRSSDDPSSAAGLGIVGLGCMARFHLRFVIGGIRALEEERLPELLAFRIASAWCGEVGRPEDMAPLLRECRVFLLPFDVFCDCIAEDDNVRTNPCANREVARITISTFFNVP